MSTPYHSQYWASALTLKGSGGTIDNLSRSIANARVDLNPHQVDAALFAVRTPLSKGVILADEVGLGKTIEAGIVMAQRWAERRRKMLLILPANLRKQWQEELESKFSLPTRILESLSYNRLRRNGCHNPFEQTDCIVICSYNFAAMKADDIRGLNWDLVIIDEAHRLRNVYKPGSKTARAITDAIGHVQKLLLTATPLQNTLLELYGLVSVIDDHVFGDLASFRSQFTRGGDEDGRYDDLKERLKPLCIRTLRKQVLEYIRFTQRIPLTEEFLPTNEEQQLYEQVSSYLQRKMLYALPSSQRMLMTLVLRKLLASSTFAIAGTLRSLVKRLENIVSPQQPLEVDDFESLDELEEEWEEEGDGQEPIDPIAILVELEELKRYTALAESIGHNAKGERLITGLQTAFQKAVSLGAPRKAVIFTESRRTQQYLLELLGARGYGDQMVLINGSNNDPLSKSIYEAWKVRHAGEDVFSGSRSADMKAALVEEFRDQAALLIATESAAEGVNLQFCSLVVNYDLPWNPQRIEQRIGRCHRYGQKYDVVVLNFLNVKNAADQRVFQILSEKFRLFDGVFGASDEVLGAIESGVDFEKRIAQVYQNCRTAEEIQTAFDALQAELDEQIQSRLLETRNKLLENFDEEVQARLKVHREQAQAALNQRQQWLLELTRQELDGAAQFTDDEPRFYYSGDLARVGYYHFDWKIAEERGDTFYRLDHPLATRISDIALGRHLQPSTLTFDYTAQGSRISALAPFIGKSGWLELTKLSVSSFDTEEYLVFAAQTDEGQALDDDHCQKLMSIAATENGPPAISVPEALLTRAREARIQAVLQQVEARNATYFDEEVGKLDRWADDLKSGLERELKELDAAIRDARRQSNASVALTEKLAAQKEIRDLEGKHSKKRRELYEAQDEVDRQRDELIAQIEGHLRQRTTVKPLFTIRWTLQ